MRVRLLAIAPSSASSFRRRSFSSKVSATRAHPADGPASRPSGGSSSTRSGRSGRSGPGMLPNSSSLRRMMDFASSRRWGLGAKGGHRCREVPAAVLACCRCLCRCDRDGCKRLQFLWASSMIPVGDVNISAVASSLLCVRLGEPGPMLGSSLSMSVGCFAPAPKDSGLLSMALRRAPSLARNRKINRARWAALPASHHLMTLTHLFSPYYSSVSWKHNRTFR